MKNEEILFTEDGKEILKTIPFTGIRRATATKVYESLQTMCQTSSFTKIIMGPVMELKEKLEAAGIKVSMTVIIMKLVAYALEASPIINSSIVEKRIQIYRSKNFAVAIATKDGNLFSPVIRNVQDKSVQEIQDELKVLIQKANDKTLTAEDMSGATYTISSIGRSDYYAGTPVVISPMVGILMIGNTRMEPVVDEDGNIVAKPVAYFSHSIDHRVVAGRDTAAFYTKLTEVFKEPEKYIEVPEN